MVKSVTTTDDDIDRRARELADRLLSDDFVHFQPVTFDGKLIKIDRAEDTEAAAEIIKSALLAERQGEKPAGDGWQVPPHFRENDCWDRHPQTNDQWDWSNNRSKELGRLRLNFACDIADPRAPDQMALVYRIDLMNVLDDLTHKDAFFNAFGNRSPAIPDGWVLVPKILTGAMVEAGLNAKTDREAHSIEDFQAQIMYAKWTAMLNAAPPPPNHGERCMIADTIGKGKNFQVLATSISEAIHTALKRGMEMDEAASCVVAVAADYARGEYGDDYLSGLAEVVTRRRERPMPERDDD